VYLDAVQDRVQRQVQIDARVIEVELKDPAAPGIDWTALAKQDAAAPFTTAMRSPVTGLRVDSVDRLLAALAEQGTVTVKAAPRLLAMNNEPALVRATVAPAGADPDVPSEAISLSVTPQIAGGGAVMLSVSPIVVTRTGGGDRAPGEVVRRESDTLARVANGETIVLAGFSRERQLTERRNAGYKGGWFGRSTVTVTKRTELVILLTPRVLTGAVTQ
jgi:type II secretory pathway component GspD/PulD (secretin)